MSPSLQQFLIVNGVLLDFESNGDYLWLLLHAARIFGVFLDDLLQRHECRFDNTGNSA